MTNHREIQEVQSRRNWDVILSTPSGLSREQRMARLIGASDVPAILRVIPFRQGKGPWDVWMDFFGLRPPFAGNARTRRGQALEPVIAQEYAEAKGVDLLSAPGTVAHPEMPFLTVHIDRMIDGTPQVIVEIKLVGWRVRHDWSEGVPMYVLAQVIAQMAAWKIGEAEVVMQCDLDDQPEVFHVERDGDLEAMVLEEVDRFWRDFIVTNAPPPLDGSNAAGEYLLSRYPKAVQPLLPPPAAAEVLAQRLAEVRRKLLALEQDENLAKQEMKQMLGDVKGFKADGWVAQWYDVRGQQRTAWKDVVADLRKTGKVTEADIQAALAAHTTKSPDRRDFRFEVKE